MIYYGEDVVRDVQVCEVVVEYVEGLFEDPDALLFHEVVVECVVDENPGRGDVVYEDDVAVHADIDGAVEMVFLKGLFLFYEDLGEL